MLSLKVDIMLQTAQQVSTVQHSMSLGVAIQDLLEWFEIRSLLALPVTLIPLAVQNK